MVMKLSLISLTISLLVFSFCVAQSTITSDTIITAGEKDFGQKGMVYPFPVSFSAKFKFIEPEKGKMVLGICKNFENNNVENSKSIFVDRVTIDMPKIKHKGNRDSELSAFQSYRNSLTSFKTELDVEMSANSTDKGDDWVLVWASDEFTNKEKLKYKVKYQQVWLLTRKERSVLLSSLTGI